MPISSVISNSINVVSDKMYYSLFISEKTVITLQRASCDNGDWLIDPTENSKKNFLAPDSFKAITDRLFSLLNNIFDTTFTKVSVKTTIQNKKLVISAVGFGESLKSIRNLETWLGSNMGYAVEVQTLWNDMNAAIEAINLEKEYI